MDKKIKEIASVLIAIAIISLIYTFLNLSKIDGFTGSLFQEGVIGFIVASTIIFAIVYFTAKKINTLYKLAITGFMTPIVYNFGQGILGNIPMEVVIGQYPIALVDSVLIATLLIGMWATINKIWNK